MQNQINVSSFRFFQCFAALQKNLEKKEIVKKENKKGRDIKETFFFSHVENDSLFSAFENLFIHSIP